MDLDEANDESVDTRIEALPGSSPVVSGARLFPLFRLKHLKAFWDCFCEVFKGYTAAG